MAKIVEQKQKISNVATMRCESCAFLHKTSSNYLSHNINEHPLPSIPLPYSAILFGSRFCWIFPHSVSFSCFTMSWNSISFHCRCAALCVCVFFFVFVFFSHHLYSPSHFPSSGFEWALVVRIVCFLIFHSIIKSSWLLKIFFTVSVFSLYHLACDSLLLIRGAELSAVCSLVHSRIPLRFWFYFGSLHIAPVNNLKSPIYNNQWKNQAREKKKASTQKNEQEKRQEHSE